MDPETPRPWLPPPLTSLRFLAALHVFCFHLAAFRIVTGPSLFFSAFLHSFLIGVCFFILGRDFRQWGLMGVLLCFAITCGLSILVYRFLEEPARRLLRGRNRAALTATGRTYSAGTAVV